jgi:hypothetical protein
MPSKSESSLEKFSNSVTASLENIGVRASADQRSVQSLEKYTSSGSARTFVFPSQMRDASKQYPHITFRTGSTYISFPIPSGLQFGDAASYSDVDLGLLGLEIDKPGFSASKGFGTTAAASVISAEILKKVGFQKTSDAVTLGTGRLMSPNKRTSFQGMAIRSFDFTFKMMPKNQQDANLIRDINTTFRLNIYPASEMYGAVLNFPPTWSIKFYNQEGQENVHLPKIYDECFLTGITSTYNAGSNLFHEDGSPVEVDITLRFQEAKALTRDDLYKLSQY